MDLPVFELRNLRQAFMTVVILNIILVIIAYLIPAFLDFSFIAQYLRGGGIFILIAISFVVSKTVNNMVKKDLKKAQELSVFDEKASQYEVFFRKRLWLNFFSVAVTFILAVIGNGKFMFYFLIIQVILFFLLYPSKALISKELQKDDILFI
ncbi:MAG: hypothetical protein ACTHMM_27305 [Agriterribacter sp.]